MGRAPYIVLGVLPRSIQTLRCAGYGFGRKQGRRCGETSSAWLQEGSEGFGGQELIEGFYVAAEDFGVERVAHEARVNPRRLGRVFADNINRTGGEGVGKRHKDGGIAFRLSDGEDVAVGAFVEVDLRGCETELHACFLWRSDDLAQVFGLFFS